MAKSSWTAGNGVGLTWSYALADADLATLPNADSVLSSVGDITNGTALDIWADISVNCTVSSHAYAAGAYLGLYLYALGEDGSTYGDGQLAAGTQAVYQPPFAPVGVVPIATATLTKLAGFVQGIVLPPGTFRWALYNGSGAALGTSGNNLIKYRTYNQAIA